MLRSLTAFVAVVGVSRAAFDCSELVLEDVKLPLVNDNQTICNKYAPSNMTQYEFMIQLVNKAFLGDYPPLPTNLTQYAYQSTGLLDPEGVYVDPCGVSTPINLVPYFNGSLLSTNRGGKPVSLNFLDGGGDEALRSFVPAYDPNSNQYKMMTHFYEYFGVLLGCTDPSFPEYDGNPSQANVHRFMDFKTLEIHYTIHNFFDAANAVGIPKGDFVDFGPGVTIGIALDNLFNKRCSKAKVIAPNQPAELQSMCMDNATCPLQANATCSAYTGTWGVEPAPAPCQFGQCNPHYPRGDGSWFRKD